MSRNVWVRACVRVSRARVRVCVSWCLAVSHLYLLCVRRAVYRQTRAAMFQVDSIYFTPILQTKRESAGQARPVRSLSVGAVTVSSYACTCVCSTCEWNLFVSQVTLVVPMVIYVFPLPRRERRLYVRERVRSQSPRSSHVDPCRPRTGRRLWRTLESFVWNKIGIWMDSCRWCWFSCAYRISISVGPYTTHLVTLVVCRIFHVKYAHTYIQTYIDTHTHTNTHTHARARTHAHRYTRYIQTQTRIYTFTIIEYNRDNWRGDSVTS